jgi:hypothetical protein
MINSRCPRPIGTRLLSALSRLHGSVDRFSTMIPGALTSPRWRLTSVSPPYHRWAAMHLKLVLSCFADRRPMEPVRFTMSPSLMAVSLPNKTTPTLSDSKFKAIPLHHH